MEFILEGEVVEVAVILLTPAPDSRVGLGALAPLDLLLLLLPPLVLVEEVHPGPHLLLPPRLLPPLLQPHIASTGQQQQEEEGAYLDSRTASRPAF